MKDFVVEGFFIKVLHKKSTTIFVCKTSPFVILIKKHDLELVADLNVLMENHL